jgi:hypothetical protein
MQELAVGTLRLAQTLFGLKIPTVGKNEEREIVATPKPVRALALPNKIEYFIRR